MFRTIFENVYVSNVLFKICLHWGLQGEDFNLTKTKLGITQGHNSNELNIKTRGIMYEKWVHLLKVG